MSETDIIKMAKDVIEAKKKVTPKTFDYYDNLVFSSAPALAAEVIRQAEEIAALKDELDGTETARQVWRNNSKWSRDQRKVLQADIAALRRALELARVALRQVEQVYEYSFICPWCTYSKDHAPDCARQAALDSIEEALK